VISFTDYNGFPLVPISDVAEVLDYMRRPINSSERANRKGGFPYYGANGQVGTIDDYIFDEDLVLVAEDGGFFYEDSKPISYRVSGKIWVNNHAHVLRPRENMDVDWLNYSIAFQNVTHLIKGATRAKLNQKELKEILVPCPSKDIQSQLVAKLQKLLTRVDEIRTLREESLKEANVILGAVIEDIFRGAGGDEVSLADVATIEGKLVDPRETAYKNMLHVGGANIVSETGELIKMQTAEEEKLISGKFVFNDKDVLYSKIRPYLKKVARPDFTGLCSADMYPLRPAEGRLHRDYLFFLLLSRDFTNYAIKVSNRAGMPKVNREQLFAYRFNLPSYKTQIDVIEKLNESMQAVLTMVAEMKEAVSESDFIQQSILKKAFAGEL